MNAFSHIANPGDRAREIERVLRQAGAVGRRNALTLEWCVSVTGEPRRVFRALVSYAPRVGVPLASWNRGYFVADSLADIDLCAADLESRVREMQERIDGLAHLRSVMCEPAA